MKTSEAQTATCTTCGRPAWRVPYGWLIRTGKSPKFDDGWETVKSLPMLHSVKSLPMLHEGSGQLYWYCGCRGWG